MQQTIAESNCAAMGAEIPTLDGTQGNFQEITDAISEIFMSSLFIFLEICWAIANFDKQILTVQEKF